MYFLLGDVLSMNVKAVYFSPTGGTEKIAHAVAQGLSENYEVYDFTLPMARARPLEFGTEDVVVFAVPVYAGRVPNILLKFLNGQIYGNGAAAVPVVVYGNRNFDDGLIELGNILSEHGFRLLAGGAFIAEHSFSRVLAAGRPDGDDIALAGSFGRRCGEKLSRWDGEDVRLPGCTPLRAYYQPRDRKGEPVNILKVKPRTNEKCIRCGICARSCPMGSISYDDYSEFTGICIKCGACEKKCPVGAKYYDDPGYIYHRTELELGYARRAEPVIVL